MSDKIKPQHVGRKAMLYVRQSSASQVNHNLESQRLQYAMQDRLRQLGCAEKVQNVRGESSAFCTRHRRSPSSLTCTRRRNRCSSTLSRTCGRPINSDGRTHPQR